MKLLFLVSAITILTVVSVPSEARRGEVIQGQASVIDGDTIAIHGELILLHGIDAPERGQRCRSVDGFEFRCGIDVTRKLDEYIADRTVACQVMDVDRWGRLIGRCDVPAPRSGSINGSMNRGLAEAGYVYATPQYSSDYVGDVQRARAERRGYWAGSFEDPAEWRRRRSGR